MNENLTDHDEDLENANRSKLIILFIIMSVVIVAIIIFIIVFGLINNYYSKINNMIESKKNKLLEEKYLELSLRSLATDCIKNETFNEECINHFKREDILEICKDLDILSDACYHDAAIINLKIDYCNNIKNKINDEYCKNDVGNLLANEQE